MKILVFSDTHLSLPFEEKKFNFLSDIINDADQVVINGDFWDGFFITFDQFVHSPWKHLFPLLKSKNAIYIYGNHDEKFLTGKNANLFSDMQTNRFEVKTGDQVMIIEHGHRLLKSRQRTAFMEKQVYRIEKAGVQKLGKKFHKIVSSRGNKKMKRKLRHELKKNQFYICGHTHFAEFDKKNRFVNSGLIRHGLGQYLIIDNGRITPKEEWYD